MLLFRWCMLKGVHWVGFFFLCNVLSFKFSLIISFASILHCCFSSSVLVMLNKSKKFVSWLSTRFDALLVRVLCIFYWFLFVLVLMVEGFCWLSGERGKEGGSLLFNEPLLVGEACEPCRTSQIAMKLSLIWLQVKLESGVSLMKLDIFVV